ncbi:MAG: exodeoxyribonuclease VII small subunit [Gemmatimonadetes bacterium]|nr:exodeoxyribonuclease VII small subunit [Gemmatimonadota bacterium]NIO33034.1 exodeoxyribonuclease VII small subunit [Gemmatimonadota bacterium]
MAENFRLGEALNRLEEIVESLEREELELEDALRLFDEGMELIRGAERELVESEGRIKQVLADRRGRQRLADVDVDADSGEE